MVSGECYLFLGPELGEKNDAIAKIKTNFLSAVYGGSIPQNPAVEATSFYAGETASSDIAAFLFTGSLFSDARIIHIKNVNTFKKADADNLVVYIKNPAENTLVFMTSDETKADKALEQAFNGKNKQIFWELFENRKAGWVRNFWMREGFNITDDGIEILLEMIENNTDALRRECSRLMFFLKTAGERAREPNTGAKTGGGTPIRIDAAAIEKYLSHNKTESAFSLFSAIAAGDLAKSLEILRTLIAAQENPVTIFAGLLWSYRHFRDYCGLCERGLASNDFELKKIGISSPKAKKDYPAAYKTYGPAADKFLAITAEFDLLLRTGGNQLKEILMDLYVYKIIRLAK
ncbi:MAG: DNA polymerase III subunit delta [Spirochaetaceae bacterium]|jgi:DNA polymerase-3 subunit delta|nr:DNA polymerase III subunit delta [Spirochaetaceae bacterium]